jgi:hypothetical protein
VIVDVDVDGDGRERVIDTDFVSGKIALYARLRHCARLGAASALAVAISRSSTAKN